MFLFCIAVFKVIYHFKVGVLFRFWWVFFVDLIFCFPSYHSLCLDIIHEFLRNVNKFLKYKTPITTKCMMWTQPRRKPLHYYTSGDENRKPVTPCWMRASFPSFLLAITGVPKSMAFKNPERFWWVSISINKRVLSQRFLNIICPMKNTWKMCFISRQWRSYIEAPHNQVLTIFSS